MCMNEGATREDAAASEEEEEEEDEEEEEEDAAGEAVGDGESFEIFSLAEAFSNSVRRKSKNEQANEGRRRKS